MIKLDRKDFENDFFYFLKNEDKIIFNYDNIDYIINKNNKVNCNNRDVNNENIVLEKNTGKLNETFLFYNGIDLQNYFINKEILYKDYAVVKNQNKILFQDRKSVV